MSEWISVEDRLPLIPDSTKGSFHSVLVIVTDGIRVDCVDFQASRRNQWAAWSIYGAIGPSEITHWMPLPEPPK